MRGGAGPDSVADGEGERCGIETENGSLIGDIWNSEHDENEQAESAGDAGGEGAGDWVSIGKSDAVWGSREMAGSARASLFWNTVYFQCEVIDVVDRYSRLL